MILTLSKSKYDNQVHRNVEVEEVINNVASFRFISNYYEYTTDAGDVVGNALHGLKSYKLTKE